MHSHDDYRTNRLKDRLGGRWITKNRRGKKLWVETLGRSFALSLRVLLLRKNIGVESFNFWHVTWAFVWIRICMTINAYNPDMSNPFFDFFNPFLFSGITTGALNMFSFAFLIFIIWYYIRTEFKIFNKGFADVLSRGESVPLQPLIENDSWFFKKEGFVQSAIAPAIGIITGLVLFKIKLTQGLGIYFFVSSIALLIDEINYHRADIRLTRIIRAKEIRSRRKMEKQKSNSYDDLN